MFNGECKIVVSGNNHFVRVSNEWIGERLSISINNQESSNCSVIIENGTIESLDVLSPHSDTGVHIHSNHMISKNVFIQNTDSHPIYELSDPSRPVNKAVKTVNIAPHCWLGMNVTVMKDVSLPENTIVGYGAVVTKSFTRPNTVIAGIPAKIIKENVQWDAQTDKFFI